MIYLIVGLDRETRTRWHGNVRRATPRARSGSLAPAPRAKASRST